MKGVLLQVLIIIIHSFPAYKNGKIVKSIYNNDSKFKKSLRYLRLTEQILTDDVLTGKEELNIAWDTVDETTDITLVPTILIPVVLLTYGNFATQKLTETSEISTIKITYNILTYYYMVPISKVITITIRVYVRREENYLLPEDVETTCNLIDDETSAGIYSYNCSGETKLEVVEITDAKVNTNEEIKIEGNPRTEYKIQFTGQAIIIGDDLMGNSIKIDTTILTLTDGRLTNKSENSFNIEGTITNFNHNPDDIFNFLFTHFNDRTNKYLVCKVASPIEKVDETKSKVTLNFGPYYGFLNITLDYAIGTYRGTPEETITLVMAEDSRRSLLINYTESSNYNSNSDDDKSNKLGIIIGIIVGVILVSIIIIVIIYCKCRKKEPPSIEQNNNGSNASNESDSKYNVTSLKKKKKNTKGLDIISNTSTSN